MTNGLLDEELLSEEGLIEIWGDEMSAIGEQGDIPLASLYFCKDGNERLFYQVHYNCALDRYHRTMLTR